jgi:L-fuculose-phosphate aldolase
VEAIDNQYARVEKVKAQIVTVCRLMYEKGFICASDGNVSARLGDGRILITPSGLHKGFLTAEEVLAVDESGRRRGPTSGPYRHLKPTSEMPMHLEAYRQRPDLGAVVHAHPPITIALSIAGVPMADCLLPEAIVFLGIIPTTEYATPSSQENVRAIRELIRHHDAIVLQRHGSLTVGGDPMQAFMRLETMEQNARIAFMLAQLGVRSPLEPAEVKKLLAQRRHLGLSRAGEEAEFCEVCGVCHSDGEHATVLRSPGAPSGPETEPPGGAGLEPDAVRALVSRIVRQTLGTD